jgi:hypothetical protein
MVLGVLTAQLQINKYFTLVVFLETYKIQIHLQLFKALVAAGTIQGG